MRLPEVRSERLFGTSAHVVPLNMEERITIIHGPNGYGKTAMLRMIAAVFSSAFHVLCRYPFQSFALELDDDTTLTANYSPSSAADESKSAPRDSVVLEYPPGGYFCPGAEQVPDRLIEHVSDLCDVDLRPAGYRKWVLYPDRDFLSSHEVISRFADELPGRLPTYRSIPDWLETLQEALPIHLIPANRLENVASNGRSGRIRSKGRLKPMAAVRKYARDLASRINAVLTQYAELAQSLDRTFPQRLVSGDRQPKLAMPEMRRRLAQLEDRRKQFTSVGLLGTEEHAQIAVPSEINESKLDVLSVYVEDAERKLGVFDELFRKIDLFKRIINGRFLFKQLVIDKERGLTFETEDGQTLSATSLSTGEQHEVVLLYQLLLQVKPKTLILIDEPEISLHVAWQKQFLKDLQEIAKLSDLDFLIATHSPQIISDRWDLTVRLEAPT